MACLDAAAAWMPRDSEPPGVMSGDKGTQRISTAVHGQPIDIDALLRHLRDRATLEHAAGVLMARYELADATTAIHALRTAALRHHVGPNALARALIVAPRPWREGPWFPPRVWRSAPELDFLPASSTIRPAGLLWAALDRVTDRAQTAQGDIQSVTKNRTGLKLERAEGFSAEFFQHFAHVEGDATACGIAMRVREPITVAEVTKSGIFDRAALEALVAEKVRAVYSLPLCDPDGCEGVVSVHYHRPGQGPSKATRDELSRIAYQTATWLHWYRRTATLDALEDLHHHRARFPG
ncbi:ANTAR domain-containing protein [Amycolatopsis thailandensis]|uniref:ANTAR domain-containing protein n=1 Tax=Amycolatopsis thailandensis TaxID=589330 RepID=UPI003635C473